MRLRRFPFLVLLAFLAAVSATGCRDDTASQPEIVATTTQTADMARNVAGTDADVKQILRPGADPHEYEPRPSDAEAVANAKVVIRSGGDVDDWLSDVIDQAGGDAEEVNLIDHVDRHGDDPHWWQDPTNAERATKAIAAALSKADPVHAKAYDARAGAYVARLQKLDGEVRRCVAKLPTDQRKLVTSHDALGYYARRYGFVVIGAAIPSLSTQAQPSAAATQDLVDLIKREHVAAIFPESAVNPKLEEAIARDAGAKVGGALWADALGPPGSTGDTYEKAIASNTRAIVSGLSGGEENCADLSR